MKALLLTLFLLFSTVLVSQNIGTVDTNIVDSIGIKDSPFDHNSSNSARNPKVLEFISVFPGGQDSLYYLLEHSFDYVRMNYGIKRGKISVYFHLDRQGALCYTDLYECQDLMMVNLKLLGDKKLINDLRTIFRKLPRWKPAQLAGKGIPTVYAISLTIPYTDFKSIDLRGDSTICHEVDRAPDFIFGEQTKLIDRIKDFTGQTIKLPLKMECKGTVFYQCTVECDGSLSHFKLIRGINSVCDAEALRVLQCMPNWIPAEKEGENVRSLVVIPIVF